LLADLFPDSQTYLKPTSYIRKCYEASLSIPTMPIYPFHRGHAPEAHPDKQSPDRNDAPAPDSNAKRLGKLILFWIAVSWTDVLGMILLAIAGNLARLPRHLPKTCSRLKRPLTTTNQIYKAPLASTHTFPITFPQSGDIVYPSLAYPNRGWTVPSRASGIIAALVPISVILVAQLRVRSFWDFNNGAMGVGYALLLGSVFQVVVKVLVGGLRPYFLDVYRPDVSRAATTHDTTGLNGVGFRQIMYTADVCSNPDRAAVRGAMMSFPSGHATAAFAGLGFLFLWMNAKLKVWSNYRTSIWSLALLFAPLLGAVLQACVLTVDRAHHWYDIVAGAAIGTVMAFGSYRVMYASVFDWRYNHIPLKRTEAFDYPPEIGPEYKERYVSVRKHSWGGKRRGRLRRLIRCRRESEEELGAVRSSATPVGLNDGSVNAGDEGKHQPNMTNKEYYNGPAAGDEMV